MSALQLDFATTVRHDNGILEIIPHHGIEISEQDIAELKQLVNSLGEQVLVLVNRQNDYSHSFDAIQAIRRFCRSHRIAALAPTHTSKKITATILGTPSGPYEPAIFDNRDQAINWLLTE